MKKVISIFLIAMIVVSMCVLNVQAADYSLKIRVTVDKTEVKAGETVNVKFTATDLNVGNEGLFSLAANLLYDTNVFETVSQSDITLGNGWTMDKFANGKFTMTRSNFIKEENDILTIKLTAKQTVGNGTTEVGLNNTVAGVGATATEVNIGAVKYPTLKTVGASTNVTPTPTQTPNPGDTTPTPTPTQTPNPSGTATPIPTPTNGTTITINGNNGSNGNKTPTATTTATPTSTSDKANGSSLPKTGSENIIIPAIIVISLAGLVAYVRYNKMKY